MARDEALIDIENIHLCFVRKRPVKNLSEVFEHQIEIPYYVGQYVHVLARCNLSEDALKRFSSKRLQGQRSHPASPNLIANIKRQICSTFDITCSVNVSLDKKEETNENIVLTTCEKLDETTEYVS